MDVAYKWYSTFGYDFIRLAEYMQRGYYDFRVVEALVDETAGAEAGRYYDKFEGIRQH